MTSRPSQRFAGVIPPIVTPMTETGDLDVAGLERLLAHVMQGNVHGVFALGTTGEGPSLDPAIKRSMIERTCALTHGRVRVIVCVSDTCIAESVRLAEFAHAHGADALAIAPPYYFPLGQAELLGYFEQLIPRLPLPLFLYNMPAMTKVAIAPDTARRAFDIPGVIGMKDSSGSMGYFHQIRQFSANRPDLSLLVGAEDLLAESLLLGFDGGVCGGANVFPRLYVDLYDAAQRGDLKATRALHDKVLRVGALYSINPHAMSAITGIKAALSSLGICDDFVAAPLRRFGIAERQEVTRIVATLRRELAGESPASGEAL